MFEREIPNLAHILLLEDELALARQYSNMLESLGHGVAVFSAFPEAWDYFVKARVDLVIADLFIARDGSFEKRGGISLISRIKQLNGSDVPILAISASFACNMPWSQSSTLSTARTVGANATLAKPITQQSLKEAVEMLLDRGQTRFRAVT